MRKIGILLALVMLSVTFGKAIYFLKDGFSFRRIHCLKRQDCVGLDASARKILSQTFYYLGRGRQCFAFASEDGNYVLKFPRTDIFSTPFWARVLPIHSYRQQLEMAHQSRELFLRDSFHISQSILKKETGVIAVHLGQTPKDGALLKVVDAAGSTHQFPLHKTSFILQYKYPLLIPAFSKALETGNREEAKHILDALIDVIATRARLGILNKDASFLRNYGYDGKQAYQIDVGSFFEDGSLQKNTTYQKSLRDSTAPIIEWLQNQDLALLEHFNKKLNYTLNIF